MHYGYYFTLKFFIMANPKTDNQGFITTDADKERDLAAKGGPMTGLGQPDDEHEISAPYNEDTQTQLAAKSTEKKKKKPDNENKNC